MYKIFYIDSSDVFGGGQVSLLELLSKIDRSKFYPVAVLSSEGKLSERIRRLGIEYKLIRMPRFRSFNLVACMTSLCGLLRFISLHKADLIHANTSRAALYGGLAARLLRIPLVWHVRVAFPDRVLDNLLTSLSRKVIAVSRAASSRFPRLPRDRIEVVHNGVDVTRYSPEVRNTNVREEFGLGKDDIVIGTVGRLSPEKGHLSLVSAMQKVKNENPQAKILVCGEGSEDFTSKLRRSIEDSGLSSSFILTGFREDIPGILGTMDIFCLPSLTEAFSRVLLEAMACGLPVVATRAGGNPEIIKEGMTGLMISADNPQEMAASILRLMRDAGERERMGSAGRQLILERFSIEQHVRDIEGIYEEVIG